MDTYHIKKSYIRTMTLEKQNRATSALENIAEVKETSLKKLEDQFPSYSLIY